MADKCCDEGKCETVKLKHWSGLLAKMPPRGAPMLVFHQF
jgi:hypothetical protein